MDTDPDIGWYSHFYGTIIDVSTDINPYKKGTHNYLIKRRSAMDRLYLDFYFSWRYIGSAKCIKNVFIVKKDPMSLNVKKDHIFMNSLKIPVLHDNTFYGYILCVTCFSVCYIILSIIHLFCELHILTKPL